MNTRRSLIGVGLTLLLLGVGLGHLATVVLSPPGPSAYRRLRLGMTASEVHAAIGVAPGYYSTRPRRPGGGLSGQFAFTVKEAGVPWALVSVTLYGGSIRLGRERPRYPGKVRMERWGWNRYRIHVA